MAMVSAVAVSRYVVTGLRRRLGCPMDHGPKRSDGKKESRRPFNTSGDRFRRFHLVPSRQDRRLSDRPLIDPTCGPPASDSSIKCARRWVGVITAAFIGGMVCDSWIPVNALRWFPVF
jgi:hypothetical protein